MWQNSKAQNVTKPKNTKCDKIKKKTQNVTQLKMWEKKNQNFTTLKNSKCDKKKF